MGAADKPHAGLEADDAVDARRAGDRTVGLGPDGSPCEACCHCRAAARGRAAGIAVDGVGVAGQPANRAPPTGGVIVADIGPFGEIGLAEDETPIAAQVGDQRGIAPGLVADQGEAACRGGPFARLDIVLHQHGAARQQAGAVDRICPFARVGVVGDDRIEHRSGIVDCRDPLGIAGGRIARRKPFAVSGRAFGDGRGGNLLRGKRGGGGEKRGGAEQARRHAAFLPQGRRFANALRSRR